MPGTNKARYWVSKIPAVMKLCSDKGKEITNLQVNVYEFQLVTSAVRKIKWIRELLGDSSLDGVVWKRR